jgi:hypothetical protein
MGQPANTRQKLTPRTDHPAPALKPRPISNPPLTLLLNPNAEKTAKLRNSVGNPASKQRPQTVKPPTTESATSLSSPSFSINLMTHIFCQ